MSEESQTRARQLGSIGHFVRCLCLVFVPYVYYDLTEHSLLFSLIIVYILASPLFLYISLAAAVALIFAMSFLPGATTALVFLVGQSLFAVSLTFSQNFVKVSDEFRIESGLGLRVTPWLRRLIYFTLGIAVFLTLFRSSNLPFLFCLIAQLACLSVSLARLSLPASKIDRGGVIALVVSCVIALVLVEVGSRYIAPASGKPSDSYVADVESVFTLKPGGRGNYTLLNNNKEEIVVDIEISEQGIRDDRVYGPKSSDEFRIVVLGDSFTMGHGLTVEQTYGRVIERQLADAVPGKRFTVINMGCGGFAPWQEAIFLEKWGFKLEPDLVIWQIFPPNDVAGTYSRVNKVLPAFDEEWERRYYMFRKQNEPAVLAERWMQTYSNLYALLASQSNYHGPVMDWVADFRLLPEFEYPHLVQKTHRHWLREPCLVDWYPELTEAFDMMCKDIAALKKECDARKVDLIGFAHSDEISLFPKAWEGLNRGDPRYQYEMNKDVRVTQECFEKASIPYVDVVGPMLRLPEQERLDSYYHYDGHLTPFGAEQLGRILADYLKSEYLADRLGS